MRSEKLRISFFVLKAVSSETIAQITNVAGLFNNVNVYNKGHSCTNPILKTTTTEIQNQQNTN